MTPGAFDVLDIYEIAQLRHQWDERFNVAMRGRLFDDAPVAPWPMRFYAPALRSSGQGRVSLAWATG